MNEPITNFGRYYPIFQTLERELTGKTLQDVLVIGPGSIGSISYQPFETANTLIGTGNHDFHIDITDIRTQVLEIFQQTRNRHSVMSLRRFFGRENNKRTLVIHEQFLLNRLVKKFGNADTALAYIGNFFPYSQVRNRQGDGRIIDISGVLEKMSTHLLDLGVDDFPRSQYDLVVCTAVMGPADLYRQDVYDRLFGAVKPGGYIITEPIFDENSEMQTVDGLNESDLHTICLYRRHT